MRYNIIPRSMIAPLTLIFYISVIGSLANGLKSYSF